MRLTGEWELNPRELAEIFQHKGWAYHTPQGLTVPSARSLEMRIAKLIQEAIETGKTQIQSGRLMVWKDPELPGSYDVWLNLGYVWDEEVMGGDDNEEEAA